MFLKSTICSNCCKVSKALVKGLVKVAEQVGGAVAESIQETELGKKVCLYSLQSNNQIAQWR